MDLQKREELLKLGFAIAYCAGYYDAERRRYAYGVIIIDEKNKEHEICGSGMNQKYLDAQAVAGEIFGVLNAMDWAVSNGYDKLMIYNQSEQIGKWIADELKPEGRAGKMLHIIYETKYAEILQCEVQALKASDEFSLKAVELAKKPLSEGKRIPVSGDNWFLVEVIGVETLLNVIETMKNDLETLTAQKQNGAGKVCYTLTLDSDQLNVIQFMSVKQRLLVRGADSILFQVFVTYLNEHADIEIEKVLSDAYRKRIDSLVLDQEVAVFFPTVPPRFSKTAERLVRQGVIHLSHFTEGEGYFRYVLPILKARAAWLKEHVSESEVVEDLEEYYKRMLDYKGPVKNSKDLIQGLVASTRIANKEDADTIIRNTLYDLNASVVMLK